MLHKVRAHNFSTIHILDKIFTNIFPVLISFTEVETKLFGRFLNTLLEVVMYWHSNLQIYEKECYNHPCFVGFGKTPSKPNLTDGEASDHSNLEMSPPSTWNLSNDFEQYRLVVFKWHSRMTKVFSCYISIIFI